LGEFFFFFFFEQEADPFTEQNDTLIDQANPDSYSVPQDGDGNDFWNSAPDGEDHIEVNDRSFDQYGFHGDFTDGFATRDAEGDGSVDEADADTSTNGHERTTSSAKTLRPRDEPPVHAVLAIPSVESLDDLTDFEDEDDPLAAETLLQGDILRASDAHEFNGQASLQDSVSSANSLKRPRPNEDNSRGGADEAPGKSSWWLVHAASAKKISASPKRLRADWADE
jgi:hypothetical protein